MSKRLKVFVLGSCNFQQFPIIDYGGIESSVEHLCGGLHTYFKDAIDFCVMVPKIINNKNIPTTILNFYNFFLVLFKK